MENEEAAEAFSPLGLNADTQNFIEESKLASKFWSNQIEAKEKASDNGDDIV